MRYTTIYLCSLGLCARHVGQEVWRGSSQEMQRGTIRLGADYDDADGSTAGHALIRRSTFVTSLRHTDNSVSMLSSFSTHERVRVAGD